jgi:hypothetical protein
MITLEQVRLLDRKVNQAVELISALKSENQMLNDKLESYQKKISELEVLLSGLKEDQSEVELGFRKALDTLSGIEKSEEKDEAAPASEENLQSASAPSEDDPVKAEASDTEDEDDDIEALEDETESESEDAELDIF